jgi:hypothetical protein
MNMAPDSILLLILIIYKANQEGDREIIYCSSGSSSSEEVGGMQQNGWINQVGGQLAGLFVSASHGRAYQASGIAENRDSDRV